MSSLSVAILKNSLIRNILRLILYVLLCESTPRNELTFRLYPLSAEFNDDDQ